MRLAVSFVLLSAGFTAAQNPAAEPPPHPPAPEPHDVLLPNAALLRPFAEQVPIVFQTRNQNAKAWDALKGFWNDETETVLDPTTGKQITRKVVKLKVPLGLSQAPPVPPENPMTLAKWELGKQLYFDPILSSNRTISCATCHAPVKGFTDQSKTSTGINGGIGGMNAPTVLNSAYNRFQFWDGRAASLEEQSQGPPGNPIEMFAEPKADAWESAVRRMRATPEYVEAFKKVFGHAPTRDAAAKAVAAYERTVLTGNSLYDRAEVAMRKRFAEEESKPEQNATDYAVILKEALAAMDPAAKAVGVTEPKGIEPVAKKLANGRALFFGKARCSNCHVGDNFTDNAFHNLGVGVKDGKVPTDSAGRFAAQPTGHKNPAEYGAFKTPGLRGLLGTAPYMHDGSEKTLEAVIDLYDKGGNVNEFLDAKMRDQNAEAEYLKAKAEGKNPQLPTGAILTRSGAPIVPFLLKLTPEEKADLVLFMKALQGDAVDPTVADPKWFPKK